MGFSEGPSASDLRLGARPGAILCHPERAPSDASPPSHPPSSAPSPHLAPPRPPSPPNPPTSTATHRSRWHRPTGANSFFSKERKKSARFGRSFLVGGGLGNGGGARASGCLPPPATMRPGGCGGHLQDPCGRWWDQWVCGPRRARAWSSFAPPGGGGVGSGNGAHAPLLKALGWAWGRTRRGEGERGGQPVEDRSRGATFTLGAFA